MAAQPSASCVQALGRFVSFRFHAVQGTSLQTSWMPGCGTAFTHHRYNPTQAVNGSSIAASASAAVEAASKDEQGLQGPEEAYGKVRHLSTKITVQRRL